MPLLSPGRAGARAVPSLALPFFMPRTMHQANVARLINLMGLLLGFVGTIIMARFSYSLQPFEGGSWGSPEVSTANEQIAAQNAMRARWQRRGMYILSLAFLAQAAAACLS